MPAYSAAVEDYAKAIYALEERDGEVSTTSLAARMRVTPASASAMIRKLAEHGLVTHTPYKHVELTECGRALALDREAHPYRIGGVVVPLHDLRDGDNDLEVELG